MLSEQSKNTIKKAIELIANGEEFSCNAISKAGGHTALAYTLRAMYGGFYGLSGGDCWPGLENYGRDEDKQQRLFMLELFLEANS